MKHSFCWYSTLQISEMKTSKRLFSSIGSRRGVLFPQWSELYCVGMGGGGGGTGTPLLHIHLAAGQKKGGGEGERLSALPSKIGLLFSQTKRLEKRRADTAGGRPRGRWPTRRGTWRWEPCDWLQQTVLRLVAADCSGPLLCSL